MRNEFGSAVKVINDGRATQTEKESLRVLPGAGAVGVVGKGDVDMAGEFAAEQCGFAGAARPVQENGGSSGGGAMEREGEVPVNHNVILIK